MRRAFTSGVLCLSLGGALAVSIAAAGCAWLQGETGDEELKELDSSLKAESRETPFDQALRNLGAMLEAYDVPRTPIQCKNIGNDTAEKGALPSDLYTMISTSIGKVGREVVFVPFDANYVMSEASTGGRIERVFPEAVIAGGITGFDKDMIEKDRKGQASGGWAGASGSAKYNAGEGVSRITLDLSVLDYKTQSGFPGVLSSNAIVVRKDRFGWGVSGSYMGCGGSFDSSVKTKQGVHAALRFLVEFSVLELLGKYFEVPYWKCLEGANEDSVMCQRVADRFRELPDSTQAALLKRMLFLHGVQGIDRSSSSLSPSDISQVQGAMASRGCKDSAELYVSLWKSVPLKEALDRVVKDRKRRQAEAALQAEERRKLQEEENAKAAEQERQRQQRIAQFYDCVKKADAAFDAAEYAKARELYKSASELFSGEERPRARLAELDAMDAKAKADAEAFSAALSDGDRLLAAKDYEGARSAFSKASALRPDAPELKSRLEELGKYLKKKTPTGIGSIGKDDFKDDSF